MRTPATHRQARAGFCKDKLHFRFVSVWMMRALKVLVVVMGIMLIGGFAVLIAVVAGRLSQRGAPPSFASAIDIPHGARIEAMAAAGADRLLVRGVPPVGRGRPVLNVSTTRAL